jgi:hypothetical protein
MSLPSMPKSLEDFPVPLQEGACQGLQANEIVRHLIFSSEFKVGKFEIFWTESMNHTALICSGGGLPARSRLRMAQRLQV